MAKAGNLKSFTARLKPCPSTVLLTAAARNKADEIFEQGAIEYEFHVRPVRDVGNTRSFDCAQGGLLKAVPFRFVFSSLYYPVVNASHLCERTQQFFFQAVQEVPA